MYDEQETAFIIKQTAKAKNITIKQLLENCNLSINTVSELSKLLMLFPLTVGLSVRPIK